MEIQILWNGLMLSVVVGLVSYIAIKVKEIAGFLKPPDPEKDGE